MLYDLRDTIVAVASPAGGAARGIVRLSGPDVPRLAREIFASPSLEESSGGVDERPAVHRGWLRLGEWHRQLPALLYLWPGERSYTRGPTAELHTLGSPPLLAAAVDEFCRRGARPAAAGEFTLRAFLAGRIDLTQAEAVLGVIDAAEGGQLEAALTQLAGGLATPLASLRSGLLDLLARLEAGLDFVGEDIEFITANEIAAELATAAGAVEGLARQIGSRGESAELVRVVLVGLPNAGKSSLFNALAGANALVSDQPGTTRDYLTARLDFGGIACELVDTAGLETDGDVVMPHAQRQTEAVATRAQIALVCIDSSDQADRAALVSSSSARQLFVLTKHDLAKKVSGTFSGVLNAAADETAPGTVSVSALTGHGLDELRARIGELAQEVAGGEGSAVASTAARAAHSVQLAAESIGRAIALNWEQAGEELVAAEIRIALDELGTVSGEVTTDDVLDRIFSRFCIGK